MPSLEVLIAVSPSGMSRSSCTTRVTLVVGSSSTQGIKVVANVKRHSRMQVNLPRHSSCRTNPPWFESLCPGIRKGSGSKDVSKATGFASGSAYVRPTSCCEQTFAGFESFFLTDLLAPLTWRLVALLSTEGSSSATSMRYTALAFGFLFSRSDTQENPAVRATFARIPVAPRPAFFRQLLQLHSCRHLGQFQSGKVLTWFTFSLYRFSRQRGQK